MYRYYNRNPEKEMLPDCVIRAISLALNVPYYEVVVMLYENSIRNGCPELYIGCYEKLLDDICCGHFVGEGMLAEEIAQDFSNDILLIRVDGHLTCSIYGIIYDIWDCSKEEVTDFWIV